MKRFIALLRGINVSGQKKIKMSELKSLFEDIGFQDVETYIQSGNVIFSSKENIKSKLESKIAKAIIKQWGFDVQIFILDPGDIDYVLKTNPFIKKEKGIERLYVTFLSDKPTKENIQKLNSIESSPDEYQIDKNLVYLFLPNGAGKTKLSNNFFENKLKLVGTTRNWKTIKALSERAQLQ